jgi:hypothetical protein
VNAFDFIPNPHVVEPETFRNYVLMSCTFPADEPDAGDPEVTDYWAFHDGDDCDVPAWVPIGFAINGEWNWGACLCDFDERKSAEVHRMDRLLPHEVQREFQSWLLKRESLTSELNLTRAEMVNISANYPSHVHAALALRAAHLRIELKQLEAA